MKNRQTILEISENAFEYNIRQIKNYIGESKSIMPVIKANAYGTYINENLNLIKDFEFVAVAIVQEAEELRKLGYKNKIFILNQPYIEDIESIISNNVTIGVSSVEFVEKIGKCGQDIKVHLELETGMGRTGIMPEKLDEFIEIVKGYDNIKVEGIYTHFSSADCNAEFTSEQFNKFVDGVEKIKNKIPNIKYIHTSASNGILNFSDELSNIVRPGMLMYGYYPAISEIGKIDLKPVAKLKSKISFIKEIESGHSISYGRSFIAENKMKIATIGMGYADGLRCNLSNCGEVVIKGHKVKIVGKICMDSFMVDITGYDDIKEWDEVYIWDNEIIHLEDVAKKCNTTNYEILSTISERVPRKFV